jgi:enoyl-CoA hydratase/carnithine racemase
MMATQLPAMREFRTEMTADRILHLIFDMPGRSMNVFSNAAIHEIDAFANWLPSSDVSGVVIRSGKTSAFCAGADLGELGVAYDMIMAGPRADRKSIARDHFAPIGRAFRKLETAGKPVVVAINGLALGGGCEFALGCHYRVLADTPQTALGLPESLVGLFPGGGGTQRMPRLIGLEKSLPILLEGSRLSPHEALAAGAADAVCPAGEEVEAAERWIRGNPPCAQPWDRPDWRGMAENDLRSGIALMRERIMSETRGHYPAPLAILDCLERGLAVPMNDAIAIEIDIFADLIKRPEPRNMIQTLFIAKQDYDKRRKAGGLPAFLDDVTQTIRSALDAESKRHSSTEVGDALRFAGFAPRAAAANDAAKHYATRPSPQWSSGDQLWFEAPQTPTERLAAKLIATTARAVGGFGNTLNESDRRLADYIAIRELGFPAYAGGPFAVLARLGDVGLRRLLET